MKKSERPRQFIYDEAGLHETVQQISNSYTSGHLSEQSFNGDIQYDTNNEK